MVMTGTDFYLSYFSANFEITLGLMENKFLKPPLRPLFKGFEILNARTGVEKDDRLTG